LTRRRTLKIERETAPLDAAHRRLRAGATSVSPSKLQ
jgi:hypothetical protein